MTHTYKITGMTCESCQVKVQQLLSNVAGVTSAHVNLPKGEAEIIMQRHVSTPTLQQALNGTKYQLSELQGIIPHAMGEPPKSWLQTYKPVLLIFVFITGTSLLAQANATGFSWMLWMRHFMAGFFIAFSFFKFLNLPGFADSYSTYDVIARRWRAYAYIYPFIELALGILFLAGVYPLFTNLATLLVMAVSLVGVLQSVLNKRKIRCACLGDVFNLPMSTVTIIEDALMVAMSLIMVLIIIK